MIKDKLLKHSKKFRVLAVVVGAVLFFQLTKIANHFMFPVGKDDDEVQKVAGWVISGCFVILAGMLVGFIVLLIKDYIED